MLKNILFPPIRLFIFAYKQHNDHAVTKAILNY